jgi:hypothetical protein
MEEIKIVVDYEDNNYKISCKSIKNNPRAKNFGELARKVHGTIDSIAKYVSNSTPLFNITFSGEAFENLDVDSIEALQYMCADKNKVIMLDEVFGYLCNDALSTEVLEDRLNKVKSKFSDILGKD